MRILKQLSLLICAFLLASQAHAMLRGCVSLVRAVPRLSPNVFRAAGAGVNYLNNGGMPNLTPGQPPAFGARNPLHFQPVHYYTTVQEGGGFTGDDADEEGPSLVEQIEREMDGRDFLDEEVTSEVLLQAQAYIDNVFEGRDIRPIVEGLRGRVILDSDLFNFLSHVELHRLPGIQFEDPAQAFVAALLVRYFSGRDSVGYTLFEQALKGFEENPAQFLVDLEEREALEGIEED